MEESIITFIALGFMAQMIDGALGMAYGVFLTTALTFVGVPVVSASASIHFAEIVTTFLSGCSHFKLKNIDMKLLKKIAPAGVVGAIIGSLFLSYVNSDWIKPIVSVYLLILGIRIIVKSFYTKPFKEIAKKLKLLGFVGGFCDAVGGGGWGPIVTSTLLARGHHPHKTIGTVNVSEFFVTVASSAVFVMAVGIGYWKLVLGLIIGGGIAAPLAAYVCLKFNPKWMLVTVGTLIVTLNLISLFRIIL